VHRVLTTGVRMEEVHAAKLHAVEFGRDIRHSHSLMARSTEAGCMLMDEDAGPLRPVAGVRLADDSDLCAVLVDRMVTGDEACFKARPRLGLIHWLFGAVRIACDAPWLVVGPATKLLGEAPLCMFDGRPSLGCLSSDLRTGSVGARAAGADRPQPALVLEQRVGEIVAEEMLDVETEEDDPEGDDEDEDEDDDDDKAAIEDDDDEEEEEDDGLDGDDDDDDM